jgi:hypothetical protein
VQVPNLRAASITFTETLKEGWSGSLMAISTWASFTAQNFVFLKSTGKRRVAILTAVWYFPPASLQRCLRVIRPSDWDDAASEAGAMTQRNRANTFIKEDIHPQSIACFFTLFR